MFNRQSFSLKSTGLFDQLILDYVWGSNQIQEFYKYPFNQSGFKNSLADEFHAKVNRRLLVGELKRQQALVNNTHAKTNSNIEWLLNEETFTVTTGHQLCLFTGPLYFIYKIISVINLCETLKSEFPDKKFVPVYWMASEDHDAEEINHANVFNKKVSWLTNQKGSVGEFSTDGIASVINELKTILGHSPNADELIDLFTTAYTKHTNLSLAMRYIVNEWFGEYGLVVLDGNSAELKKCFTKTLKQEITEQVSFSQVTSTISKLSEHYKIQVNPREINLFYKDDQLRERLVKENTFYKVNHSDLSFSYDDMIKLIDEQPEKFSPNVVLRPVFQQTILPNVAYVGGPGELAYWLEYKNMFESFQVSFPVLVPRQFVSFMDKNSENKWNKLGFTIEDTFREIEELTKDLIRKLQPDVSLEGFKQEIEKIYLLLQDQVLQIDKTLQGSVDAEKQKTLNGISSIEQKMNKAIKQKSETDINQIKSVKTKLYPNQIPQERYDNVSMYYAKYGKEWIMELKNVLTYQLGEINYTVLTESK